MLAMGELNLLLFLAMFVGSISLFFAIVGGEKSYKEMVLKNEYNQVWMRYFLTTGWLIPIMAFANVAEWYFRIIYIALYLVVTIIILFILPRIWKRPV